MKDTGQDNGQYTGQDNGPDTGQDNCQDTGKDHEQDHAAARLTGCMQDMTADGDDFCHKYQPQVDAMLWSLSQGERIFVCTALWTITTNDLRTNQWK